MLERFQVIIFEILSTVFRILAVSWFIFSFLEFYWTGFVSNYFNVHLLLISAILVWLFRSCIYSLMVYS